ncbi:MAG: zinc ribbon domain-containing protein [Clostridia bacterium]|nr:zinc ribbon domain-containing protein [Clostridia bacterium]
MNGFCINCGRPLGDGEKYCIHCGMPVLKATPVAEKHNYARAESVWLLLSLVGTLLSFFSVLGAVFCLVGAIGGSVVYRKTQKPKRREKTRLIAAMLSGYLSAGIAILFHILLWIV